MLQRLNDNHDDLVIMGMVPADKPLASLPFLNNELVPVAPADPLLHKIHVSAQDFLESELLIHEPGSGSRLALEQCCQQQRLNLRITMELGSNDVVKQAVIAGLGVAVLPKISIFSELALVKLHIVPLEGFKLRRSWCVVHRLSTQRQRCRHFWIMCNRIFVSLSRLLRMRRAR